MSKLLFETAARIRSIRRVRAIEEFEGDILAELRTPNGDTYVEKWCSYEKDGSVRTLIVRTTKEAIAEYEAGTLSMLSLLVDSNENRGILADWKSGTLERFESVEVSSMRPSYLPDPSAVHDPSLRPKV